MTTVIIASMMTQQKRKPGRKPGKSYKPTPPKRCPYCKDMIAARGLQSHIFFKHRLNGLKKKAAVQIEIEKKKSDN